MPLGQGRRARRANVARVVLSCAPSLWVAVRGGCEPGAQAAQGFDRSSAHRPDQFAVVLVRDLARAVIELELLERREGPVAFLDEREPPGGKAICARGRWRLRPAEQRVGDVEERPHGYGGREDDRNEHQAVTGRASISNDRRASCRCSRASGHMATTDPSRNKIPASQIRSINGLTATFRTTEPSRSN